MKWKGRRLLAMALTGILLAGCGAAGQVDDYATNEGCLLYTSPSPRDTR